MKDRVDALVLSSRGHAAHFDRVFAIRPGHRVRIDDEDEEFIVLRVDPARHVADLLRPGSVSTIEAGISLSLLRILAEPHGIDDLPVSA